jgi:DNA-binding NarL/FixJ family response regulator
LNIIVVEDTKTTRLRLVSLLDGRNDFKVVASMESAEEALEYLAGNCVDLVILDLGLPGLSDDLAVKAIRNACPNLDIMVYTATADDDKVFSVLKAGATGYLLKDAQPQQIITAVEEIKAGGAPMSPCIARKVLLEFRKLPNDDLKEMLSPLSSRETEILELLYHGSNTKHIAETLCISWHTVHAHIKKIYGKLYVNSRSQAIYEALNKKLLKV